MASSRGAGGPGKSHPSIARSSLSALSEYQSVSRSILSNAICLTWDNKMQLFIDTWDKVQKECDEQHVKEYPPNSAKNCLTLGIWVYTGHDLQVLFQINVQVFLCLLFALLYLKVKQAMIN